MNSYALRIREEIKKIPKSKMFCIRTLYNKRFSDIPETAFFKTIERMCSNGDLVHESKGIYVRPIITEFGIMPITEEDIINTYTLNKKGMVVGYRLFNNKKITTQSPRIVTIYSNSITETKKVIKNVIIKRINIVFTDEIISMINTLEILKDYQSIEEPNPIMLLKYMEKFSKEYNEKILECVLEKIQYSKSTLSSLKEFLDFFSIKNNISKYLSTLSNYKTINIRSLYETTSEFNFI